MHVRHFGFRLGIPVQESNAKKQAGKLPEPEEEQQGAPVRQALSNYLATRIANGKSAIVDFGNLVMLLLIKE